MRKEFFVSGPVEPVYEKGVSSFVIRLTGGSRWLQDGHAARAARLLQRAVKALGYSATNELQGPERYLVARLLRRKTKVPIGWLTEQLGMDR